MRVLADGRVRRTRWEWQTILNRFRRSGLSVDAFCEREEISRSAFREWRRKLGEPIATQPDFVELTELASRPAAPEAAARVGDFELSLPGGVILRWKA